MRSMILNISLRRNDVPRHLSTGAALVLLLAASAHFALAEATIDARAEAIGTHTSPHAVVERLEAIHSLSFTARPDGKDEWRASMIKMKPHFSIAGRSAPDCGAPRGSMRHAWEAQPRRQRRYQARGEAAKATAAPAPSIFRSLHRDDAASVSYSGDGY